jgi:hypothetical protein
MVVKQFGDGNLAKQLLGPGVEFETPNRTIDNWMEDIGLGECSENQTGEIMSFVSQNRWAQAKCRKKNKNNVAAWEQSKGFTIMIWNEQSQQTAVLHAWAWRFSSSQAMMVKPLSCFQAEHIVFVGFLFIERSL